MKLVADLGNTRQKMAVFDAGNPVALEARKAWSSADIELFLNRYPGVTEGILSSVVEDDAGIRGFLHHRMKLTVMDEHTPVPLVNRYASPATLGRDRLAAAVGAASLFPGDDVLAINAGTALTFDFVTRNGEYLGGSIAPGMEMRFKALHTFTGRLPLISYHEPVPLTGPTTEGSILSGVAGGMAAEIDGMAGNYLRLYPGLKIVVSGGDLNYFVNRLKSSIFATPNLVILGLYKILTFNDQQT